ncbi:MAG: phosphoribosylaminoimidazolesuccinocarboxamide synthase [Verrucomicrobia bacterium]|nr:phosphoribosylaminoimidazolesuccinocarboxamide synthase [Verrucomicrobiota bacterium]
MCDEPLLELTLPGLKKLRGGKVREIFELGDHLLFVATDRISAFDCILPTGIPRKGEVLSQISHFWFNKTAGIIPNHRAQFAGKSPESVIQEIDPSLVDRSMIVEKAQPLPIECVVRGYLAGSGWKEYRRSGTVCGIPLPEDLAESAELPEPIFTPATKAQTGHDENISFEQAGSLMDRTLLEQAREASLKLYSLAREYAIKRGIIIADTKFEFGLFQGHLILIDEALTPDSSRFWPVNLYTPGTSQPSFDKQYVRDYLEQIGWNKLPPAPALPKDVVIQTRDKYLEAYARLTGNVL